jgi:tellurite methyltransferase
MNGGYDEGYRSCPCFWGREPGSLVRELASEVASFSGMRVLDAGCGEGKNAAFFAQQGALVTAVDISRQAIANAEAAWPPDLKVSFQVGGIETLDLAAHSWDVVLMYGLLHCLPTREVIELTVSRLQQATRLNGFHVLCAFNDRAQDLTAHPGFSPTTLPHDAYVQMYRGWHLLRSSDSDLHEVHPHNNIPHSHSMTRLLAQKV